MRTVILPVVATLLFMLPVASQQEKQVAVILVNFQDKQEQPYTPGFVQGVMTSVDGIYRENSYNQIFLTADVWGWYTIASSYTTCDQLTIASQAKFAAQAAGANLSSYQHFIYMFPANACPWFASATIGPIPTDMWIKGQPTVKRVAHEFGHNLGLLHSRSYDCGTVESICSNGTYDEWGDHFDLMGDGEITQHLNVYQKERLGWLTVTDATIHGDYVIGNLETAGQGLKVQRGGQFYYIEKRSALSGVLIHLAADPVGGVNSSLLDMNPLHNWAQAALAPGRSFVDVGFDIGIYLVSAGPTSSVVRVTCAACVPPPDTQAPTVTITSPLGPSVPRNTTIPVNVTASDNVGVDHVQILVNNVQLCVDSSMPYSCQWSVPGKKNASYTITARAYDAAGNFGTHSIEAIAP